MAHLPDPRPNLVDLSHPEDSLFKKGKIRSLFAIAIELEVAAGE
jgi:hypothetical protein